MPKPTFSTCRIVELLSLQILPKSLHLHVHLVSSHNRNKKQEERERGRTRKPRVKRDTTGIPWTDKLQPPVPPLDAPQMPQPSPNMPMRIPPPTQTRPSDEPKAKKKGTKQEQERGQEDKSGNAMMLILVG